MAVASKVRPFREVEREGKQVKLRLNFHSGQATVWDSAKRFVYMMSGTQVGKTCFGPHWLMREMQRCGAGDYLICTATFPLLNLKLLPEFLHI